MNNKKPLFFRINKPTCGTSSFRRGILQALFLTPGITLTAATTWTGGSGNWSDAGNWNNGIPATSGDTVTFDAGGNITSTIDSTWATAGSVDGIVFGTDNFNYTFNQGAGVTSLSIGAGGISGTKADGTITLNGSYQIAADQIWDPGARFYLYGDLTGAGDITLNGTKGIQFWSGSSSAWTGDFYLNGGTASFRNLNQFNRLGNQVYINNTTHTGFWSPESVDGGDYSISSNIDFGDRGYDNSHTMSLNSDGNGTLSFTGDLSGVLNYRSLRLNATGSPSDDYRTVITGNNTGLTQAGSLSSTSIYGAIHISGTRLQLAHANALGTGNNIFTSVGGENVGSGTVRTSGLYTIGGVNVSADLSAKYNFSGSGVSQNVEFGLDGTGSAEFSGDIYLQSANQSYSTPNVFLKADTGGIVTFSGTIQNFDNSHSAKVTSITATGGGTVILAGDNTYTASTTVAANTALLVNNTTGSGTGIGAVAIESTGTLGGIGYITPGDANGVTAQSGSTIAPGASIGTLTLNGSNTTGTVLTMDSGSVFDFELGASNTSDKIVFWDYNSGDFSLNNNTINFSGTEEGSFILFEFYSDNGITPIASGINTGLTIGSGLDGFSYTLDYNPNNITLNVVPEPSTFALILSSIAMVFALRRRP